MGGENGMTEEGKGWQPGDQGGGAGEEGPEKGGWGRGGRDYREKNAEGGGLQW